MVYIKALFNFCFGYFLLTVIVATVTCVVQWDISYAHPETWGEMGGFVWYVVGGATSLLLLILGFPLGEKGENDGKI